MSQHSDGRGKTVTRKMPMVLSKHHRVATCDACGFVDTTLSETCPKCGATARLEPPKNRRERRAQLAAKKRGK